MRMLSIVTSLLQVGLSCIPDSLMAQQAQTAPRRSPQATRPSTEPTADMKKEIASLKARIDELETLKKDLQYRLVRVELTQNANQTALLDLTSHAYQRLDSSTGTFLISFEDATPYLDGYRVALSIGNPSFATFKGFKLHVKWNTKYDWANYTSTSYAEWNKTMQERDSSFVDELKPGTWNIVTLLLPSTTNSQLSYFLVSIETSTVSLHTDAK
jgi:TolA-binding protein